jgi:quercetin dioxygenase-like cupin family protein
MLPPTTNGPATGETTYRLGIVDMRLLAASEDTGGEFSLGEFRGAAGPWTVPHVHRQSLEAFYVLDGRFTFTVGSDERLAVPGELVLIPRDTPHVLRAEEDGGRLLVLWTPGGLEQMFIELSRLAPDALRDPSARKAIASRFDSIPI